MSFYFGLAAQRLRAQQPGCLEQPGCLIESWQTF
jgi:hypothetical protein